MSEKTILVFHGITMSGTSTLRQLGPIRDRLEAAGFTLLAPNGGRQMSAAQVAATKNWLRKGYAARNQDPDATFRDGVFWDEAGHFGWFHAVRDQESRRWDYRALATSLQIVQDAARDHTVIGVLGFSQGCAMAAIVASLASKGNLPGLDAVRFGVFLSGFLPRFDTPALDLWPVSGVEGLFLAGTDDAVFPDPAGMNALAAAFGGTTQLIEGLQHTLPTGAEQVDAIVNFAITHRQ